MLWAHCCRHWILEFKLTQVHSVQPLAPLRLVHPLCSAKYYPSTFAFGFSDKRQQILEGLGVWYAEMNETGSKVPHLEMRRRTSETCHHSHMSCGLEEQGPLSTWSGKGDEQPAPASTAQACLQNFALGSAVDRDLCKCSERTTFLGTLYLSFARQFFYGVGFLINKECLIEHKGHSQRRSLPRRVCSRWCCGSWCHWQDDLYDLLFHHHR